MVPPQTIYSMDVMDGAITPMSNECTIPPLQTTALILQNMVTAAGLCLPHVCVSPYTTAPCYLQYHFRNK